MERSHAPVRHGQAHDIAVVQAVLELRERWRHWGPKKLRVKLGELHPLAHQRAALGGEGCGFLGARDPAKIGRENSAEGWKCRSIT